MFPASLVTTEQHLKPALILIALIPTKATHFPRCLLTRQFASSVRRAEMCRLLIYWVVISLPYKKFNELFLWQSQQPFVTAVGTAASA